MEHAGVARAAQMSWGQKAALESVNRAVEGADRA